MRSKILVSLNIAHTLPANGKGKKGADYSSSAVARLGVKRLKQRIDWNMLGPRAQPATAEAMYKTVTRKGVTKEQRRVLGRSGYRVGLFKTGDGGEVMASGIKGWSPLPFVVVKGVAPSGLKSAKQWLKKTVWHKKKSTFFRADNEPKGTIWPVTLSSLRELNKELKSHAGGLMGGWMAAANKLGVKGMGFLSKRHQAQGAVSLSSSDKGIMSVVMTNSVSYGGGTGDRTTLSAVVDLRAKNNFKKRDVHFLKKLDGIQSAAMSGRRRSA